MLKYQHLIKLLDTICEGAPNDFVSYKFNKENYDEMQKSRSKAFIHLFLESKCGILSFFDRHNLITDGPGDGGLDAYFIDKESKKLYIVQSKFRNNNNFKIKSIDADDLVKMEICSILKGATHDSNGVEFNNKIKRFQSEWKKINDPANYVTKIIILGNLTKYNDFQIKKLIDNYNYEIFNFERVYNELVFPLISGTYYDPSEIVISLNLKNKNHSTLKQTIKTKYGNYDIRLTFVPVDQIGRIMLKYKNSILKYNPRNYLSLSSNKVNKMIKDSILKTDSNDFAILNNGITMIAEDFRITEGTGRENIGQIIMLNPQIINGGQTAYTLSKIYENTETNSLIFENKEVMLKVIIISSHSGLNLEFIEDISNSTNQQSKVDESDRRSNDKIQVELQQKIYDFFGFFMNVKEENFIMVSRLII